MNFFPNIYCCKISEFFKTKVVCCNNVDLIAVNIVYILKNRKSIYTEIPRKERTDGTYDEGKSYAADTDKRIKK